MKIFLRHNFFKIALIIHILIAFFSSGFQHFDEHFQIIELINFKLGGIDYNSLPWDFKDQIRSWFQPFVYYPFVKALNLIGINSPFISMTILRLITSLFGLYALKSWWPLIRKWVSQPKAYYITILAWHFLWFVPYIFVRTSSESFGISFFLLGSSLFLRQYYGLLVKSAKYSFIAGLFFAFSYLSRFQMALPVAALWIGCLAIQRKLSTAYILSAIGVLFGIGLGVIIDFWGYGNWTFSLYNYYDANIAGGIMENVKQYPWWWYFRLTFLRGMPPVSLPLILVLLWGWVKYFKHPLTWMTLPLFAFHCYIGHKEMRYIYPIMIFLIPFMGLFIQEFSLKKPSLFKATSWKVGRSLFWGVNILFVFIVTFRAANPAPNFYQYLWNQTEIRHIHAQGASPYKMLGLTLKYYLPDDMKITEFNTMDEVDDVSGKYFFFSRGKYLKWMDDYPQCKMIYLTYPLWSLKINISNWVGRSRVWSLFYCK